MGWINRDVFVRGLARGLAVAAGVAVATGASAGASAGVPRPVVPPPVMGDAWPDVPMEASGADVSARVAFDTSALPIEGAGRVTIDAGPSGVYRATLARKAVRGDGADGHWAGPIDGGGMASITVHKGMVVGAAWLPDGTVELRATDQRNAVGQPIVRVIELAAMAMPACSGCDVPNLGEAVRRPEAGPPGAAADQDSMRDDAGDDPMTATIVVGYTPTVVGAEGGFDQADALAQAAVDATNMAYGSNAQLAVQVQLVGTVYCDGIDVALDRSSAAVLRRLTDPGDGLADQLNAAREPLNADLASLLCDLTSSCGRAWLAPNTPDKGVSVVDWTCAVGNLSFAHEVGHNRGCAHDRANAGAVYEPAYGYGYQWQGTNGTTYRSVMATSSGLRVPLFSTPLVAYQGAFAGVASGPTAADNARLMNETRDSVSNFRQGLPIGGDCDNDGVLDSVEIALGEEADANGNGVPDACDIALGVLDDCDENGVADIAQLHPRVAVRGPTVGPIAFPSAPGGTFGDLPRAAGLVTFRVAAYASVASSAQTVTLELFSPFASRSDVLQMDEGPLGSCNTPPNLDSVTMSAAEFNALSEGGLSFELAASPGVSEVCSIDTYGYVTVFYDAEPAPGVDDNGDGVLDACQEIGCNNADLAQPFEVLNFADVQSFLGAFNTQQPQADLAAPAGVWNFADVQSFLGLFNAGC